MGEQNDIRELPATWKKLNLGCNQNVLSGWVNVDLEPFEGVEIAADLEKPWPWEDGSIHYIRAVDIVEHLHDPIHTMNEAWRVLGQGGIFEILVPSTDGRGAFQDPTHVSFWNQNSFIYYSRQNFAGLYPSLIKCDFEFRCFDTQPNDANVIWTWALCKALKDPDAEPMVPETWFDALSAQEPERRVMPGYAGSNLGTMTFG